jgi:phospholipid/cholesterol/gamma-HCH transport system substrate-binding protein
MKDGDFLAGGRVAPDPLDALMNMQDSFDTTLGAIKIAGDQVAALALDVRKIIGSGEGELERISQQTEVTIANFNQTLDAIESLFRDPNLRSTLDTVATRLPELVDDAQAVLQQVDSTLGAFEGVGLAAEETMKNIADFTAPLGDQGERIVGDALSALQNLDALLVDLRSVAARVTSSQGTVARLLDDDQLYYSFINTLQNVESLTHRLQPIVEDARVVADKVARDPSVIIGLRPALTGRPRGTGVK